MEPKEDFQNSEKPSCAKKESLRFPNSNERDQKKVRKKQEKEQRNPGKEEEKEPIIYRIILSKHDNEDRFFTPFGVSRNVKEN